MLFNIIGCGPTGMTIAWNLVNRGHRVNIYERKDGPGGSWWEPDKGPRDYHAYRAVFNRSFVNTHRLLNQMGLNWDDYFGKDPSKGINFLKYFDPMDYPKVILLALRVFMNPQHYKKVSLKSCVKNFSGKSKKLFLGLPYTIDGVPWDRMTAYEFFQSINMVAFSIPEQTQIVSGAVLFNRMKDVLEERGVVFNFGMELLNISYSPDSYRAMFTDGTELSEGTLVLAVDNGPARWLIGDNWGPNAQSKLESGMYTCMNILFYYDKNMSPLPKSDMDYLVESDLNILAKADGNTVSCVLCDVDKIHKIPPGRLVNMVLEQTGLPKPIDHKICWGSEWNGQYWTHSQTSGAYPLEGTLPFYGECSRVALVGMMSPRQTPYASIEAAIEVGNTFTEVEPLYPLTLTRVLIIILIIIIFTYTYN